MRTALTAAVLSAVGLAAVAAPPPPPPGPPPARLVAHEWGTFTSFSGADGVPVGFHPTNVDLPLFVYHQGPAPGAKADRLLTAGTVSMETPVVYLYADRETRATVTVGFPRGWITEWYPFAAREPKAGPKAAPGDGQTIRWDVRALAGQPDVRLPRDGDENDYFHARDTDAAPLQVEADVRDERFRGGVVVQREKFLFYRGVGAFPPPVTARGLGGGQVRLANATQDRIGGVFLVHVRNGRVGFRAVGDLSPNGDQTAALPPADRKADELSDAVAKELVAAGLYPKEARAMVNTWHRSWFGEDGQRVLYLVPRARTDELLPIAVDPKPAELVRLLVGRHDFLTPEQEAAADDLVRRREAARAELARAEQGIAAIGRFAPQARQQAEARAEKRAAAAAR